jgi:hypothetical protein
MYTGNSNPAAAIGDITSERLGTAKVAITGRPPFPKPTNIAARVADTQNVKSMMLFYSYC